MPHKSSRIWNKLVYWLAYGVQSKILSKPRRSLVKLLDYIGSITYAVVVYYVEPERSKIIDLIRNISKKTEVTLQMNEAYQLFTAVQRTKKIKGDIAEVGVYKGGSAMIICEAKEDKPLHLFDTFEGLPEIGKIDAKFVHKGKFKSHFKKGEFKCQYEEVKNLLSKYKDVHIYKGLFPDTAGPVKNRLFSLINLDVDTYESTSRCLKFFYPRMNKGGVIMSHDYTYALGVKAAFDEFFKDKPETIIELSGTQCLVVKL